MPLSIIKPVLLQRVMLSSIGCVVVGLIGLGAIVFMRFDDAYAQWGAADMVIDYMSGHHGRWPKSWDDLQPYFETGKGRVSGWSYEKFQKHVWIDFSANSQQLRELAQNSETPPFNVIGSTSVFGAQFDDGPNGMLLWYFNPSVSTSQPQDAATVELAQ